MCVTRHTLRQCAFISLPAALQRGLEGPGLILVALSTTKQRDRGEGSLKGTVTLKVSFLRRLERDRGKKPHNAYSHLAGGMISPGCQAC